MTKLAQHSLTFGSSGRGLAFVLTLVCALTMVAAQSAQAQTFTVLYNFAYGPDGDDPVAGLTMDQAGNLYGAASAGGYTQGQCGSYGCGTVFELTHRGSGWIFNLLYTFTGPDGSSPAARVLFGPDGDLYGTTTEGGAFGQGTVFRLEPPARACASIPCPWTETVLHSFSGGTGDGGNPQTGDLTFDRAGNIYGSTSAGGSYYSGTVYELSPSNGGWTENILYNFHGTSDGDGPWAGVVFDTAGNLYGTTVGGGAYGGCNGFSSCGTVYKLAHSALAWKESVLYSFSASGAAGYYPLGGLIFDSSGNIYGITVTGGQNGAGAAYELTPSSGGWTLNVLYSFTGPTESGSSASMTMDAAGNLYGTLGDTSPQVFRLTPSDGQWMLTGFNGRAGGAASGSVILDAGGNLYTTAAGGLYDGGIVFEITP